MHELDFKDWLYEEGLLGNIARRAKIPSFILGGALALGATAQHFQAPTADAQVQIDPRKVSVDIPEKAFAFHMSGYDPISPNQIHIEKIGAPSVWKKAVVNTALTAIGGIDGLKQRIADRLNADPQKGYTYQTPGAKFGEPEDLSGQETIIRLKNTPVDLGNGNVVLLTGWVEIKAEKASIAFAK